MRKWCWLLCCWSAVVLAEQTFPKPDWQDKPSPVASPQAVPGGEISYFAGQEPSSLNYYLSNFTTNAMLFGLMFDTLLGADSVTLDETPGLARKWAIADDKLTFTFWLDERARWSDGKPITAGDVKWTFDTLVTNPKTGSTKVYLDRLNSPEVLDERTVRFRAKFIHWDNLNVAGGFQILPKHYFDGKPFEEQNRNFEVVSGPYRIKEYKEHSYLLLEKRADWWQKDFPSTRGVFNFQMLRLRWYEDDSNAFEAFKKGQIDIFPVNRASRWVKETVGERFEKNWIVKQRIFNHCPIGFQGFAMNERREPLKDVRVRQALCYLLDREKMNETLMFRQYELHTSYYQDLYDKEHPCPNPLIAFNVEKARQLLTDAGWAVNPQTGKLEQGGKPFELSFLTRDESTNKFLAIYREDLKEVGIELNIVQKDLSAWDRDMNEFAFDMTWAAWSAGVRKDPEGMWDTKYANMPTSNNYTGFHNPKVDELIEKQKPEFDLQVRHGIVRQIDQLIYQDYPYILLWYIGATRLLYWNKFGTPDWVLSKYDDDQSALSLWWIDPDAEAELKQAVEKGTALPKKPDDVRFDEAFKP